MTYNAQDSPTTNNTQPSVSSASLLQEIEEAFILFPHLWQEDKHRTEQNLVCLAGTHLKPSVLYPTSQLSIGGNKQDLVEPPSHAPLASSLTGAGVGTKRLHLGRRITHATGSQLCDIYYFKDV
jgi:hypothetical protein